jgi:hypothetical protein
MAHRTITSKQLQPGDHFVTITNGMRGWFAVEMWVNNVDFPGSTFWEPWQTDDFSFRTADEARVAAIQYAAMCELPYLVEGTTEAS